MAGGEVAEGGGEGGEGGSKTVELGEGFLFCGAEGLTAEAGLGACGGEALKGLEHLAGQAATASGETFEFFALGIALPCPPGGGGVGERPAVFQRFGRQGCLPRPRGVGARPRARN